ncbi:MAG: phosphate--acyl-ACP acyltransferase [Syntrophobacteraceae bacterium]
MRIAIDAMGGDHAPGPVVEGTLLARSVCSADLVLIGNEPVVREALGGGSDPLDLPAGAIRKKREASLNVAMRMLAEGEVDAVVSAGNTSAIVAAAKHFVGLLPGLRRPALAVPFPTEDGRPVLLDAGAHAQSGAIHLAQSAALAHIYLRASRRIDRPSIGLLNIGHEPAKGTRAVQRAFALIKRSGLNFIGNLEPNDLFNGRTDAVICEGFVGNIVMKMYEGLSEGLIRALGGMLAQSGAESRSELNRIFEGFQKSYAYQHVGGAPLLGVKKPVVVAHGRSESQAISSAVQLAYRIAKDETCRKMTEQLEQDSSLADFKYFNAQLILEDLKKKWGFAPK